MMMMATVYIVIEVCICEFCEHCIEMKRQRRHYDNDGFHSRDKLIANIQYLFSRRRVNLQREVQARVALRE
jgi:hypothetical protein